MTIVKTTLKTFFILLCCWQVSALAATVTQQADGYGATPQDATADALVNASRQAQGVVLTLNPDFRKQSMDWVAHQNKNGNVITQQWSDAPEPRMPTLAGIESYRVTALSEVDKTLWKASVEVKIVKNESLRPERNQLTSVVVLPFRTTKSSYQLNQPVAASTVSSSLRQSLVESLTQSQQVRVLNRVDQSGRANELLQSASSLTPSERAKLGKNLGADLILSGKIDTFQLGRTNREFYGSSDTSLRLHTRLHYNLIDVATGDILAAKTVTYDPPSSALRAKLKSADIIADIEPERLVEVIFPQVATLLTNDVLNIVAPLEVLKVAANGSIYISGGEGRVQVGDTLAGTTTTSLDNAQTGAAMTAHHATDARLEVIETGSGYALVKQTAGDPVHQGSQLQRLAQVAQPIGDNHPMTPGSSSEPLNWN